MPRKTKAQPQNDIAQRQFEMGRQRLGQSPLFAPLLLHAEIVRAHNGIVPRAGWAVAARDGTIFVHPTRRAEPEEWQWVLGHCLLHLAFDHFREDNPPAWNAACDCIVARFLADTKIGAAPLELNQWLPPLPSRDENQLARRFANDGIGDAFANSGTAGDTALDMLWTEQPRTDWIRGTPLDWAQIFAQGLSNAVTHAVRVAAGADTSHAERQSSAQRARSWFISSYPLLGALAAAFEMVEDMVICGGLEILVAAIDVRERRIYLNPAAGLSEGQCRFVMAHEFLHAALRHDSRRGGRDAYLWNVACFPAGTWTGWGKPIEEVATMCREFRGELVEIRAQAGPVRCTPEHPLRVRHRRGKSYPIRVSEPQWVEAHKVNVGDYLLVPRLPPLFDATYVDLSDYMEDGADSKGRRTFGNRALRGFDLDTETAWMIGLYVAEGSTAPRWSLGAHETEIIARLHKVAQRIGCSSCQMPNRGKSVHVVFGSRVLGRWLKAHCGAGAHSKKIPQLILRHSDAQIRAAFLEGLMAGDGHITIPRGKRQTVAILGSVSESLIADVFLLLAQDGQGASRRIMRRGPRFIGSIWTDKPLVLHFISWNPSGPAVTERLLSGRVVESHSHRFRADEHGVWYPVKEVTRHPFEGKVYNLSTLDHTYVAQSYLVHNCDYVINDWLLEMAIGDPPTFGMLHDPALRGQSAEAIYDEIAKDLRRYRKLQTMRGVGKSDILGDETPWWKIGEGVGLDAWYRGALSQGLAYHEGEGRGLLPAGLVEEIRALEMPVVPWDVELAHWFDAHFAPLEKRRSYARLSRRQSAAPDIVMPSLVTPPEAHYSRTFGVVLDTSGSMPRELLGRALGTIASYAIAHDVRAVRVVFCDASAYDAGWMRPEEIAGSVKIRGRGGTILQPGVQLLESAPDFPATGPMLILTDAQCESDLIVHRDHAFVVPRGARLPFNPRGPVFEVR